MAKFMLIYREPTAPMDPPSPEQMQAFLGMWTEWFKSCGANLLDGGDGLKRSGKVVKPGGVTMDGPYVEAKEVIAGYTVVAADDYEGAVAMAKTCPISLMGGDIEIRELAGYNVI